MLKDISNKLEEKNATLIVTDAAKDLILKNGYDVKYGARPLKRAIRFLLEDKLARLALTGEIKDNSVITADCENDEIVLKY